MTQPLVFVVGAARSGTTLMGSMLGLHPSVFAFRELHFFEEICPRRTDLPLSEGDAVAMVAKLMSHQRMGIENRPDPRRFTDEAAELLKAFGRRSCTPADAFEAFLRYEAGLHGKTIPCDHTPPNVLYAPLILRLYPAARVVHMVRDPRDVLASQKHKWRMRASVDPAHETLRRRLSYHPLSTSLRWNVAVRAGGAVSHHERYRALRFEDLISDAEAELRSLCGFLGLQFARPMLEVAVVNSSFEKPRASPPGMNPQAVGRWSGALAPADVRLCQRATRRGMRRHGYRPATVPLQVPRLAVALVLFPAHALLALLMRSLRFRKLLSAVIR